MFNEEKIAFSSDKYKKYEHFYRKNIPKMEERLSSRDIFYVLLNFEDYSDYMADILNESLLQLKSATESFDLFVTFSKGDLHFMDGINNICLDISNMHGSCQIVPTLATFGNWLNSLVSIKDSCEEYGGILLQIHNDVSLKYRLNLSQEVVKYFTVKGDHIINHSSADFCYSEYLYDYSFHLPAFLLSISKLPTLLLPEILGANLFMMLLFKNTLPESENLFISPLVSKSKQAILSYMKCRTIEEQKEILNRVNVGFIAAYKLQRDFQKKTELDLALLYSKSIEVQVVKLLHKIGTKAYGQHSKGCLAGKKLDDWFNRNHFNSAKFLSEFKKSKYIKAGSPEKSTFIKYLTAPHGPMFRVFSDDDLSLISSWISQLDCNRDEDHDLEHRVNSHKQKNQLQARLVSKENNVDLRGIEKHSLRDLYYQLLNIDLYPNMFLQAKIYTNNWLNFYKIRSKSKIYMSPIEVYTHQTFESWVIQQHDLQVNAYTPLSGLPEQSEREIIDDAIKLAPLTLIDGAWLRGFSNLQLQSTAHGSALYNIYVDELGNGDKKLHHGNIYQKLLGSMGVNLPDFRTTEFSQSNLFKSSDFRLPVFWLSISLYSKTYMPEILGLNLAMELSGIGGEYRRSGDILRHYGYSSQFTDLHNSIDNIATGHTAWAIDAIKSHMESVYQLGGNEALQKNWNRVWIGYLSLQPPKERSKFSFLRKKLQ